MFTEKEELELQAIKEEITLFAMRRDFDPRLSAFAMQFIVESLVGLTEIPREDMEQFRAESVEKINALHAITGRRP